MGWGTICGAILFGGFGAWWVTGWLAGSPACLRSLPILDLPNQRSAHRVPIVRIGGVAVVLACLLLFPLLPSTPEEGGHFAWLWLGLIGMAAVGLIDDLYQLQPLTKFGGQVCAAIPGLLAGGGLARLDLPLVGMLDTGESAWGAGIAAGMAILWITAFTNCFNFLDGLDGLAGGCAVIFSLLLGLLAWQAGHPGLAMASLLLAAATSGFLGHNFPPARIFLGDVGSLSIGYLLAVFSLWVTQRGPFPVPFPAMLLLFGPFLFDAGITLLRRWRRGERLTEAHRSHLYQRLVGAGQSHRQVTITYYLLSLLGGGGALVYVRAGEVGRLLLLLGGILVGGGLVLVVSRREGRILKKREESRDEVV
jgi:UDP-N-acetylmuramyl pentapeptide phosphotransferase/UDP-N-acetylglucosamine-1-phosphate transferase